MSSEPNGVTVARQRTTNGRAQDGERPIENSSSRDRLDGPSPAHEATEEIGNEKRRHRPGIPDRQGLYNFRDRFMRKGKKKVGTVQSLKAIVFSSWVNVFIIFIPLAWVAHFSNESHHENTWPYPVTFALCILAIVPLEKLFDYGGEQMAFYCGKDLGDLIVVSLNNAVEATLAIILLTKCHLKLLQSTIIGVVILHLLLVPGTSFIIGGARIIQQDLHPHRTQLNHTLLTIGVMTLLLPAAFFSAVSPGLANAAVAAETGEGVVNDALRDTFLRMSRGLSFILLAVYICSRIFLHNPPGEDNALRQTDDSPEALKDEEEHLANTDPEVSQWVCIAMLLVTIALMGTTAEWLVDSIEFVREEGNIQEEWFGLILLPIVSFSADAIISIGFFIRYVLRHYFGEPVPPSTLAKARAIDLSIQFTLFWMPFIVLLGWWIDKPMSLLFDLFEVALLIGACFLVNYVTADSKTNWAEGAAMVAFYLMIALCAWFYTGQDEIDEMLVCTSIVEAVAAAAAASGGTSSEAVQHR